MATRPQEIRDKIAAIKGQLDAIVCTEGEDAGVIMISDEATFHFDEAWQCQMYDNEFFTPLGDALVALWNELEALETLAEGL